MEQNLIRIEYQGQLVLTYKQVAMGLNCSSEQLRSLYRCHKAEFAPNVHFFNVEGEALHSLKREVKNAHFNEAFMKRDVTNYHADSPHSFAKGAKSLKLWTKQGVARLSKLIDTPEAWELFTALEQSYFDNQKVAAPVQQSLPLPVEPAVVVEEKACVYVFLFSSQAVKIGVTANLSERTRSVERASGFSVIAIHTSELLPKDAALQVEKTLHDKFDAHRLEGEFFNVPFAKAVRELERTLAELHLFEPLALPAINLVDKLITIADKLEPCQERQQILIRAANLLDHSTLDLQAAD